MKKMFFAVLVAVMLLTVTAYAADPNAPLTIGPITVTVASTLDITTQSLVAEAYVGDTLTISVTPNVSAGNTYAWLKGATPVGTDSPSYTVDTGVTETGDTYTCTITHGGHSVTSTAIAVNIYALLTGSITSPTVFSYLVGDTINFIAISAGGKNTAYQWWKGDPTSGGSKVGIAGLTYDLVTTADTDTGDYYFVATQDPLVNTSGGGHSGSKSLTKSVVSAAKALVIKATK